jgi:hypothetical protein
MRRIVLIGSVLLLPGCQTVGQYVGNPFVGFGGFVSDTVSFRLNPNAPVGNAENLQRAKGQDVAATPLLPEPGNVWPAPPKPEPTLQDIEREQNAIEPTPQGQGGQVEPFVPHPQPRGSSTPPDLLTQPPTPQYPQQTVPPSPQVQLPNVPSTTGVVSTPQGPATITNGGNGVQQFKLPNGVIGRAIPNGNGTVTLIGPDGSVQSVPAPR